MPRGISANLFKRITIEFPSHKVETLNKIAKEHGMSRAEYMRLAVERQMNHDVKGTK